VPELLTAIKKYPEKFNNDFINKDCSFSIPFVENFRLTISGSFLIQMKTIIFVLIFNISFTFNF